MTWKRIAEWIILKLGGAIVDELDERKNPPQQGTPLSHKDVERQQAQIRAATERKP